MGKNMLVDGKKYISWIWSSKFEGGRKYVGEFKDGSCLRMSLETQ